MPVPGEVVMDRDGTIRRRAANRAGVAVLVALEGFCEPGRECIPGELLIPVAWCGRADCTCGDEFHGVVSHGTAALAEVRRLHGIARASVEQELAESMRQHEGWDRPREDAAALLDEIGTIEDGRLVRREEDVLLPFPRAARIVGGHTVEFHLDDPL